MTEFRVEIVYVFDPESDTPWPHGTPVKRFALVEKDTKFVWVNKHPFGFLVNMVNHDHSTTDCRYLLRKTPFEAWADAPPLGQDDEYYKQVVFA